MDPLSDVLSLLKPRSYTAGGFGVGGDVAIRFPKHAGIKCYAVMAGQCWLRVDGEEPVLLTAGDCYLLPRGLPFVLTTELALEPVEFYVLKERGMLMGLSQEAQPGENFMVGGHFALAGGSADILLQALPPIVHIRKESDKAAMRWSLERMREELRDPRPGGALIAQQLAYMMLVQALRLHVAEGGVGWLGALADKQMGAALTCMHESPGEAWTLQGLAEKVGMSRSVFAERFRGTVGKTPMEYLTRWRMLLAGERLKLAGEAVAEIACAMGYESESAFSKAFRRVMGCSPRQWRRDGGNSD